MPPPPVAFIASLSRPSYLRDFISLTQPQGATVTAPSRIPKGVSRRASEPSRALPSPLQSIQIPLLRLEALNGSSVSSTDHVLPWPRNPMSQVLIVLSVLDLDNQTHLGREELLQSSYSPCSVRSVRFEFSKPSMSSSSTMKESRAVRISLFIR
jgi:hypothetical protein